MDMGESDDHNDASGSSSPHGNSSSNTTSSNTTSSNTTSSNTTSSNTTSSNTTSSNTTSSNTTSSNSSNPINYPVNDPSNNAVPNPIPPIVTYTLNETIDISGASIHNEQGEAADGSEVTHTTFTTTNPELDVQITENLAEVVESHYDDTQASSQNKQILDEIKMYASKIQCSDFHGKGTIDDYTELFQAAAKIANESKQMTLDVDIEGFDDFSKAADDLSALFSGFIIRLQNVNIINDISFLTSISVALRKIWNLSEVFGKFKETILMTSTIKLPKSAHDTKIVLEGVMDEINCAMQYITHFVSPSSTPLVDSDLSAEEKNVISAAVSTIDNWTILCDQGVNIAMANDPDLQYIKQASNELKTTTVALKSATDALKAKFASFNVTITKP